MGSVRIFRSGRSAFCFAAFAFGLLAFGDAARGQGSPSPQLWRYDQLGYAYRELFREGRWDREYRDPIRQAVAWEVGRRLPEIGLTPPRDIRRQSGMDALGRRWRRDGLGYAFYEVCHGAYTTRVYYQSERQTVAARVHEQLACVDWPAAVRRGVSSATVRGFNSLSAPTYPAADTMVRSEVRDRIVDGLNQLGEGGGFQDLPRFQRLVAEGVEDAIVSAFNQMDVIPQELGELQSGSVPERLLAETPESRPAETFEIPSAETPESRPADTFEIPPAETLESRPAEPFEIPSAETLESRPADTFEIPPAETLESLPLDTLESQPAETLELRPAESTASPPGPAAEAVADQRSVRSDRSVLTRPPLGATNSVVPSAGSERFDPLIATHYGGALHGEAFSQRYADVRYVDSGWIVGSFGTRPIRAPGFLVLWLRDQPGVVEVWKNQEPVYRDCRYEEFFEDIQSR